MAEIGIKWWPQPRQFKFLDACGLAFPFSGANKNPLPAVADIIGYGGAAGGGKSDTLLMVGALTALAYPGSNVGYFRRTYPQLEGPGGAISRSKELFSGIAKYNGTLRRWTFPGGGIIQFCHCQHESDVYNFQSQQFDALLFDEATQFTGFIYRYLQSRNRSTVANIKAFTAWATNPGGVGHVVFKEEFILPGIFERTFNFVDDEKGINETHCFIPAKLSDNQILEKRDPGYRRRLENQPAAIRRALLEGDWDVFSGQYFDEWRYAKHVLEKPFTPPSNWRRFITMDWGFAAPCAVLWHTIEPSMGRVITYKELYVTRHRPTELAEKILEWSEGEQIEYVNISPDAWQERGVIKDAKEGESVAEILENKLGSEWLVRPADDRRIIGWNRVREYLLDAPDGKPWWQCGPNCLNLIKTLPALVHNEPPRNIEDANGEGEDHAPEALRYGLMSRPSPDTDASGVVPGGFGKDGRSRKRDDDDDDDDDTMTGYGFYGF